MLTNASLLVSLRYMVLDESFHGYTRLILYALCRTTYAREDAQYVTLHVINDISSCIDVSGPVFSVMFYENR